jgi:hypothetical protein
MMNKTTACIIGVGRIGMLLEDDSKSVLGIDYSQENYLVY